MPRRSEFDLLEPGCVLIGEIDADRSAVRAGDLVHKPARLTEEVILRQAAGPRHGDTVGRAVVPKLAVDCCNHDLEGCRGAET